MEESKPTGPENVVRSRRITAMILVLVAIAALLGQHLELNFGRLIPLMLGIGFIAWSLLAREWGLLVPGGILTGLGTGLVAQQVLHMNRGVESGVFLLCFSGGWILITMLSQMAFGRRVLWPLWPAAAMAFAGVVQLAGSDFWQWFRWLRPYWPFALILVAAFLWFAKPPKRDS